MKKADPLVAGSHRVRQGIGDPVFAAAGGRGRLLKLSFEERSRIGRYAASHRKEVIAYRARIAAENLDNLETGKKQPRKSEAGRGTGDK